MLIFEQGAFDGDDFIWLARAYSKINFINISKDLK